MATYYVKNGGSDSADGLSDANAWATVTKVNTFSDTTGFAAGDSILFKRGDIFVLIHSTEGTDPYDNCVYYGQGLWIQQSGTSGSRIIIGAYGTGARPIITGRCSIPGWSTSGNWTNTSGNIWRMVGSVWKTASYGSRGRLWLNGAEVKKAQSANTPTASEPYTHDEGTSCYLYVYSSGGNPATAFSNIEDQGWSNDCIITGGSYHTYQNLNIQGCVHAVQCHYGKDFSIYEDCNIGKYSCMQGIYVQGWTSGYGCDDGIVRRCTFDTGDSTQDAWERENTSDAVHLRNQCNNWEIYDNHMYNWTHGGINLIAMGDDGGGVLSNIKVYRNYCHASNIDYGKAFDFNTLSGNSSNIDVYNNYFYDQGNEIQISGSNIDFYCNIIDTTTRARTSWVGSDMANGLSIYSNTGGSTVTNVNIWNNTFVNCVDAGIRFQTWGSVQMTNVAIENNIFCNNNSASATHYQLYIPDSAADLAATIYRNNLFWYTGADSSTDLIYYGFDSGDDYPHTVTEFNAENGTHGDTITGNILGEAVADLFVNFSNKNYHLKAGSAAIDAGRHLGLSTDYDGNPWLNPPCIGTYQYYVNMIKSKINKFSII
jgi:hypothetical protein